MEKIPQQEQTNIIKIVIFGAESTGKTTLSRQLAKHYKTEWVPEFSREHCQKKWDEKREICNYEDVIPIAVGQMKLENERVKKANKVLICDTDIFETKIYSEVLNGRVPQELNEAIKKNHYDLYLLTYIDVPWVADDVRDCPDKRDEMFEIFEDALISENKNYVLLKGNKETRLKKSIEIIDALLNKK